MQCIGYPAGGVLYGSWWPGSLEALDKWGSEGGGAEES